MAEIFKAVLRFLDGTKEPLAIPGVTDSKGHLHVPESVTFDNRLFLLNKTRKHEDYFEYKEKRDADIIPFRDDLH